MIKSEETVEQVLDESLKDSIPRVDPDELSYGYTVGVTRSGRFAFEVHGRITVPQISGVHRLAGKKVEFMEDTILGGGDVALTNIQTILNALLAAPEREEEDLIVGVDAMGRNKKIR
jgi:hypothetical protein